MTAIVLCAAIIVCGFFEEVCDYYNFNLETYIRKMQDKSRLFS
jgi:hypothetical protein